MDQGGEGRRVSQSLSSQMEKRVDAHVIAERTGAPHRTILALAQRDEIPAAKIGRRWTFGQNTKKLLPSRRYVVGADRHSRRTIPRKPTHS